MVAEKKAEIWCSLHTSGLFNTINVLLIQMTWLSKL